MLRLRQAIPTGSALCNNLGRVIGLEGATALKFPWSVLIDFLFFQRMLGRATALESLSISIGRVSVLSENVRKSYCARPLSALTGSLFFQRMSVLRGCSPSADSPHPCSSWCHVVGPSADTSTPPKA